MAIQRLTLAEASLIPVPNDFVFVGNGLVDVYTGADYNSRVTMSRATDLTAPNSDIYPEVYGALPNDVRGTAFVTTNAINSAIATGKKIRLSNGSYWVGGVLVDSVNNEMYLEGDGWRKTTIKCFEEGANVIGIVGTGIAPYTGVYPHNIYQHPVVRDISIIGNQNNGAGIYASGVVWYLFENLYIRYMGTHGIHITETVPTSVSRGSYIGVIRNSKIAYCIGDGIRQTSAAPSSQQNASHIMMCESQYNGGNGVTLWGYCLTSTYNTLEGNTGYGLEFQNFIADGTGDSAKGMVVDKSYFEGNLAGHIHVKTNTISDEAGIIVGLSIQDNFGFIENTNANYVDIKFETTNANPHNQVRSLIYKNNTWTHRIDPDVIADFANMLAHDCRVSPQYALWSSTIWADIDKVLSQHVNMGNAKIDFISSKVCQGYWDAKGGSGIVYSGMEKSDNITASVSSTFFPMGDIPLTAVFMPMSVYVDTDSTNYSVTFEVQARDFNGVSEYSTWITKTVSGRSGPQNVKTDGLSGNGVAFRKDFSHLDTILKVTITLITPGMFFYLGNPTVLYQA